MDDTQTATMDEDLLVRQAVAQRPEILAIDYELQPLTIFFRKYLLGRN
jgi:hypothetical protein